MANKSKTIKRTLSSKAMMAVWDGKNHDDEVEVEAAKDREPAALDQSEAA